MVDSRRASALLVVVGSLAILSMLGISFARLASLERDAADHRVEEVRARLLAHAGVERALAEIRAWSRNFADTPNAPWYYRGLRGRSSGHGVPLVAATAPSLAAGDTADGDPAIRAEGLGRAYSGALPGTYESLGDTYVLKILDSLSMIDLNTPSDPRRALQDEPFVRMLSNLSRAIDPVNPPVTLEEAQMLLAFRESLPGARFADRRQMLDAPGEPLTPSEYARIADFVTTAGWANPMAVLPMDPRLAPREGDLVLGRVPTGPPRRVDRRPVNLNTAPAEVLVAAFSDVAALHVDRSIPRIPGDPSWQAAGRSTRTSPVRFDQAQALARTIVARRESSPFAGWEEFESFLSGAVAAGTLDEPQAAALLANADSNADTHRANPDAPIWRSIDKFDLTISTTEFAFSSMGVFEIESIGRVTRLGGYVVAEVRVWTRIEVFSILHITAQSQFAQGAISTYRFEDPIFFHPPVAILSQGDIEFDGNPHVSGASGHVHSNGDLDIRGSTWIEGDATAAGAFSQSSSIAVGGEAAGAVDPIPVPPLVPAAYLPSADFVFGAGGRVTDSKGIEVGNGSYEGFSFQQGTGTWIWNGGTTVPGLLYFDANVDLRSATAIPWSVSIVSTGSVQISAALQLQTSSPDVPAIVAGGDIQISGTLAARVEGLVYAGEQLELSGNVFVRGAAVSRGLGNAGALVTKNRVLGNVTVEYGGGIWIPSDFVVRELPTLALHPEPDIEVEVAGERLRLPAMADYDGWIGLATLLTPRRFAGGIPDLDLLLARWSGPGLEADRGGGDLRMVSDRAGPFLGSVLGAPIPGHLMPDGIYAEFDATPAYRSWRNLGSTQGTIAFWFKASWEASPANERATRCHHLLALSREDERGSQSFQLAHVGAQGGAWSSSTGFHFERSTIERASAERLIYSPSWAPPAHRWTHITIAWDLESDDPASSIWVYVDGVELPAAIREFTDTSALTPAEQAHVPITRDNLIRLGERDLWAHELSPASAEATYDELLCVSSRMDAAWAQSIRGAGRYFARESAVYRSAALPIDPGSEILWAAMTVRPDAAASPVGIDLVLEGDPGFRVSTSEAGISIGRRIGGPVTFALVFRPTRPGEALYSTPYVDDVTIAYATMPRVEAWEEGP